MPLTVIGSVSPETIAFSVLIIIFVTVLAVVIFYAYRHYAALDVGKPSNRDSEVYEKYFENMQPELGITKDNLLSTLKRDLDQLRGADLLYVTTRVYEECRTREQLERLSSSTDVKPEIQEGAKKDLQVLRKLKNRKSRRD